MQNYTKYQQKDNMLADRMIAEKYVVPLQRLYPFEWQPVIFAATVLSIRLWALPTIGPYRNPSKIPLLRRDCLSKRLAIATFYAK